MSKKQKLLYEVFFDSMEDGLSVQIMHIGSYDSEPASFKIMDEYCSKNYLAILSNVNHREIYLSDARKTEKAKLKTVFRYMVSRN